MVIQLMEPYLVDETPDGERWRLIGYTDGTKFCEEYIVNLGEAGRWRRHGDPAKLLTYYHNAARNRITRNMIEHIHKE